MLTYEEAAQIAARKLGVAKVVTDDLYDWRHDNLLCFAEDSEWSLQEYTEFIGKYTGDYYCFVDTTTGVAISYDSRLDWEYDSGTAWADFMTGLRNQFYRLEIFDIRDWDKTRQLFQAMRLHLKTLVPAPENYEEATDWLTMDLAPLGAKLEQSGRLVFHADINGYYRFLYAGRYYECFDYALFAYDRETETVGAAVLTEDEFYENDFDDYEDDPAEFWEGLSWSPIVAAKGIDSIG